MESESKGYVDSSTQLPDVKTEIKTEAVVDMHSESKTRVESCTQTPDIKIADEVHMKCERKLYPGTQA